MEVIKNLRTDVASEFVKNLPARELDQSVLRYDVKVDGKLSEKLGKPVGSYTTVESDIVYNGDRGEYPRLIRALSTVLREYLSGVKSCLVACLGNPKMTADALGAMVADKIVVTRHLEQSGATEVCSVIPNVFGATGVESYDVIKGVVDKVKPDAVIAVDALASAAVKRIACAFQISDAGLTPGSGVFNHRRRLDKASLGVPVISFGVPLVVYATTIVGDALGKPVELDGELKDLVVTPKDIDALAADCAFVMAEAFNRALGFDTSLIN